MLLSMLLLSMALIAVAIGSFLLSLLTIRRLLLLEVGAA